MCAFSCCRPGARGQSGSSDHRALAEPGTQYAHLSETVDIREAAIRRVGDAQFDTMEWEENHSDALVEGARTALAPSQAASIR